VKIKLKHKMKKVILLFVAIVSLSSITSCSDDDEAAASLLGKWEYSQSGIAAGRQDVLFPYEHTEGCTKDFVQITATSYVDHSFFNDGGCEVDIETATYTRSGNTLTIGTGADAYSATIVTLNGNTLKLNVSSEDLPGITAVLVLTRVN
jgi:hypothetical protein